MPRKIVKPKAKEIKPVQQKPQSGFFFKFKNDFQKIAWNLLNHHDIVIMTGDAGTAKSFLSTAFAIQQLLEKKKKKIIITRPIVEAGEKLGFLPGSFQEKVDPYMQPIYDSIDKLVGKSGPDRDYVKTCLELAPIAYLRGRTLDDAVCILDEAQNASAKQLMLFLTRLGENSTMIINGDMNQSDIPGPVALLDIIENLNGVPGIAMVEFKESAIVRHPLVSAIINRMKKKPELLQENEEELEPIPDILDLYPRERGRLD